MFDASDRSRQSGAASEQNRLTSNAYDRWSRVWTPARFTDGPIYNAALRQLDDRNRKILDVGCGTRLMSAKLAESGRRIAQLAPCEARA